jgi:undecaprenyl-diphosphatase
MAPTPNNKKRLARFSVEFITITSLFLSALVAFGYIADTIVLEQEDKFDSAAFAMMHTIESPAMTSIARAITFLGSSNFLLPTYILLICFFLWKKQRRTAIIIFIFSGISLLLGTLLKSIFKRARPALDFLQEEPDGFSFPSGHTLAAFTFTGVIIYLLSQSRLQTVYKWILGTLSFLLACLIGLSRIYLHVHFASDVLGGFCVTLIWLGISFYTLQFLRRKEQV